MDDKIQSHFVSKSVMKQLENVRTYMVEEGGSDVVKVSKESEETASQFVVPHLVKTGIFSQHIHV